MFCFLHTPGSSPLFRSRVLVLSLGAMRLFPRGSTIGGRPWRRAANSERPEGRPSRTQRPLRAPFAIPTRTATHTRVPACTGPNLDERDRSTANGVGFGQRPEGRSSRAQRPLMDPHTHPYTHPGARAHALQLERARSTPCHTRRTARRTRIATLAE